MYLCVFRAVLCSLRGYKGGEFVLTVTKHLMVETPAMSVYFVKLRSKHVLGCFESRLLIFKGSQVE